ncbi:hypothetical protein C0J52_04439 [Blattella germanica]|nr:hypothetical protein C0J52_04439 [Blattella germanica]
MRATWLFLMLFTAVLLEQSEAQGGFMGWVEKQYDSFRRGVVRALKTLGSPSRRGTGQQKRTAVRSANFSDTSNDNARRSLDNSLRARSTFFNDKFQEHILESRDFPCPTGPDTPGARSPTRPTSVHELRPADIDVIGAMGDSLSAANGAAAANLVEVYIENRGMSWSIGGESTWRQYITLPNILKEFNPNLVGYSLQDGLGAEKLSQFNVAEPFSISSDMLHQAKILVKRIRSDKRVNFYEDWKLVTIMIGCNDFCSYMCYYKNYSEVVERHKDDMNRTLNFLEANLPRTLVNLVPPPTGNSLWNNMMEPVGKKRTREEELLLSRFLCPTEEHPYIYTYNNSIT